MFRQENLLKHAERAQTIVGRMCMDDYDNTITALSSISLMLVVVVFGTAAVCALTFILGIMYAGLTMMLVITDVFRSPDVQNALEKCFPGAIQYIKGGIVSRSSAVLLDFGRRVIATLVVVSLGALKIIGGCMFIVVDLLGPSRRPEERTPLESVGDGPTANAPHHDNIMPAERDEINNNAVTDAAAVPKFIDIHLHNSFRKNDRCSGIES